MSTDQATSEILAKLKNRSSGAHENIKDADAQVGGKTLPGGMKEAKAQVISARLATYQSGEYEGEPYMFVDARCVDPESLHGVRLGTELMYPLSESMFASAEENLETFYNDMKLIGFKDEILAAQDEVEVIQLVHEYMNNKDKNPIVFVFSTAARERKSKGKPTGTFPLNIQGVPEEGYEPPDLKMGKQESNGEPTKKTVKSKIKTAKGAKGAKAPKKRAKGKVEAPFGENDSVKTLNDHFEDGEVYSGVVQSVGNDFCVVTFDDDGSTSDVPFTNLENMPAEFDNPAPFEVEDRITTPTDHFGDGKVWEGTILSIDGENVVVKFDDGDEETFDVENIQPA